MALDCIGLDEQRQRHDHQQQACRGHNLAEQLEQPSLLQANEDEVRARLLSLDDDTLDAVLDRRESEALAYGLPVVATPLAASGLEAAKAGIHYVEADGPGPLAESLASVLGGESAEIGPRGRELVEAEYSIEALASLLARSNESPR